MCSGILLASSILKPYPSATVQSGPMSHAQTPPIRLMWRINEAAERSSLSRTVLYEHIRAGKLPVVKIGRSTRIRNDDLERFIDELAEAP